MNHLFYKTFSYRVLALGSTVIWGLVEFVALQGVRRTTNSKRALLKSRDTLI